MKLCAARVGPLVRSLKSGVCEGLTYLFRRIFKRFSLTEI